MNAEGIQCFDGKTENNFTLHAHLLSFSGDLPALAKVMYTTGHNSYKACCFCSIRGVYCKGNQHVYFPLKPPTSMLGNQYDPKNLPLRMHKDYICDATAVECMNGPLHKRLNGQSILFELKSIEFPASFPVDIMHGLFENIAPSMLQHWSGTFFKDDQSSDFGHPPIDIQRHLAALKAEDWLNWVVLYSLPLLQGHLPER
ncbi:7819_t:CDS:2 [Entrophospora sp. SA101]|nr:7819_t:CDS:2 [Entrophospora sp. SA101]CAJ0898274.1 10193_t:CDS:2 [Entrophospora sp. SA101]